MKRGQAFLKRHILLVGFGAVMLPLLVILLLQYRSLAALVTDGEAALCAAGEKAFDVMILDVMLPKKSGLDVCQQLRQAGNQTPIIMLTARGQEVDKVVGLRLGADYYVTKPFSFLELIARVEALLRRINRKTPPLDCYQFGDIALNFVSLEATRAGKPLHLSHREFRLLKFFIEHRGEVVTRDQLLDATWDYDHFPLSRTVDMHIAKLRQKIEPQPNNPTWLVTVHGAGYRFHDNIG